MGGSCQFRKCKTKKKRVEKKGQREKGTFRRRRKATKEKVKTGNEL